MKRLVITLAFVCALTAATAATATVAQASSCGGPTAAKCFNARIAAQHRQIVKLQREVKALLKSKTVAGLSGRLSVLEKSSKANASAISQIQQQVNCWGNGLNISEFTTGGLAWGSNSPAGGYPYPGFSAYSYLDVKHSNQPSDQNTFHVITNECLN